MNYENSELSICNLWFNVKVKESEYRVIYELKENLVTIYKIICNNFHLNASLPSYGGILSGIPTSVFSLYGFNSSGPSYSIETEQEITKFAFNGNYKLTPLNAQSKIEKYINF